MDDNILNEMGHEPHEFHKPFRVRADKNYPYVHKTPRAEKSSRRFAGFICKIAPPILKIFLCFKITGKENLEHLDKGAVTVCNHVHPLDSVALACAFWNRDTYYLSQKDNFSIPVIRHIIRKLKAVPIPDTPSGYAAMLRQIKPKVRNGAMFHIYPEGSLRTDCTVLREFKPGAFQIADMFGVPVVPCAIRISRKNGKLVRELKIGKPLSADTCLPKKVRISELENRVRDAMEEMLA
ncbi:MAG: hypothetical protein GXY01_07705 [Clostridiales bacterium]|nr:hypothetical protein [Clostridiales bacterium]